MIDVLLANRRYRATIYVPPDPRWYKLKRNTSTLTQLVENLKREIEIVKTTQDYNPIYTALHELIRSYMNKYHLVEFIELEEVSINIAEDYTMDMMLGKLPDVYYWLRYLDYSMIRYLSNYRKQVWTNPYVGKWADDSVGPPIRRMFTAGSASAQGDRYKTNTDNMDMINRLDNYVDRVLSSHGRYDVYSATYRHIRTSVLLTFISYPKVRLFNLKSSMSPYVKSLTEKVYRTIWYDICSTRYTKNMMEWSIAYDTDPYQSGYYASRGDDY